jgi:hypothetical protein
MHSAAAESGGIVGAGVGALPLLWHVQSMSEVPEITWLQSAVYLTSQSSDDSSAAATQKWPKL